VEGIPQEGDLFLMRATSSPKVKAAVSQLLATQVFKQKIPALSSTKERLLQVGIAGSEAYHQVAFKWKQESNWVGGRV